MHCSGCIWITLYFLSHFRLEKQVFIQTKHRFSRFQRQKWHYLFPFHWRINTHMNKFWVRVQSRSRMRPQSWPSVWSAASECVCNDSLSTYTTCELGLFSCSQCVGLLKNLEHVGEESITSLALHVCGCVQQAWTSTALWSRKLIIVPQEFLLLISNKETQWEYL